MRDLLLLFDGFRMDIGDAAFYSIFGFIFVFLGITLLILFFMLLGAIMKRVNEKRAKKVEVKNSSAKPTANFIAAQEEGVTPEVVAAITAALMAYYERENVKCDFVVRRIKRI